MSFSASEPFLQRLLRPGSPVTPWMPGLLPRTQTVHWAAKDGGEGTHYTWHVV